MAMGGERENNGSCTAVVEALRHPPVPAVRSSGGGVMRRLPVPSVPA